MTISTASRTERRSKRSEAQPMGHCITSPPMRATPMKIEMASTDMPMPAAKIAPMP